ncbi:hypothetical protein M0R45_017549 [Rubus argutus]|uniref:Uncharacterized protein n=1 Tax=Rubus argutus TaxID=59490 RepID=A0AAW1XXF4_RUBAR
MPITTEPVAPFHHGFYSLQPLQPPAIHNTPKPSPAKTINHKSLRWHRLCRAQSVLVFTSRLFTTASHHSSLHHRSHFTVPITTILTTTVAQSLSHHVDNPPLSRSHLRRSWTLLLYRITNPAPPPLLRCCRTRMPP